MPVIIDDWEPDGEGGYFIQWSDPSQPVTAFLHATPDLMDEFEKHHRAKRGAPSDLLHTARDAMRNPNVSDAATVQAIRKAYENLIDDIKALKARGLKHNTPHDVLEAARQGKAVPARWRKDPRPDGYKTFMEKHR